MVLVAILIVMGIILWVVVARLLVVVVVVVVVVVEVREDRVVVGFVVVVRVIWRTVRCRSRSICSGAVGMRVNFFLPCVGKAGGIANSIIIISRVCFNFTRENVDQHELIMFFVVCSF